MRSNQSSCLPMINQPDPVLEQVNAALGRYRSAHPQAHIETYRHNDVSVRVRLIDPTFAGLDRYRREDDVWAELDQLPEEVVAEISLLLLLTPTEAKTSLASEEFDHPIPSRI
jgi:hypothetical protein